MGELRNRTIVQSRIWLVNDQEPIPDYDYDYSYPITVYEAVHQTTDDDSATLKDEIDSIYRLINLKQDIIDPGIPGQIMTWSGVRGQIGALEVINSINSDASQRSTKKIPSEKAIGDALDTKISVTAFNSHANDKSIHMTDAERSKWNSMAPLSSFNAHVQNTSLHITEKERGLWNNKANQSDFENHIYDFNNPHNVTAHQVGTYTREEIDDTFANLRESFFNYKNILWNDRTYKASLVEYSSGNWNPNYILEYGDNFPDVSDPSLTYFALIPATDHETNETQDCIIYVKLAGQAWQEVGFESMTPGDMVIKYPETTMYVWVQGRFIKLFSGETNDEAIGGSGVSDKVWYPSVDEDFNLSWSLSKEVDEAPTPVNIKGADGYTPVKGVDYVDGKDGEGVPVGGTSGQLLIKISDENYDTTWRDLIDIFNDMALAGQTLPANVVDWSDIKNRPEWYNELGENEDGFVTQKVVTRQFEITNNNITSILEKISALDEAKIDMFNHINDFNNPHRTTATQIGAVPLSTFNNHVTNTDNPHNVTADQLGLGNVNNTSDMDKPISTAVQAALDKLTTNIKALTSDINTYNAFVNASWDDNKCSVIYEYRDGSLLEVHVPIAEIFEKTYCDRAENQLVLVLPDGSERRVDLSSLIRIYMGSLSTNVNVEVDQDTCTIKATIVPNSITETEIAQSVHLKGSPTTTTQNATDVSTRIATTEYVHNTVIDNLISYETDRPLSANQGRILNAKKADIDDVIQIINDMEGLEVIDNLDSTDSLAALSANMGRYLDEIKAPRVHTSPSGSTFGRATVSVFGHTRATDVEPLMDGSPSKGTDDGYYARGDHRHPTDISRAPIHWPDVEHNQYEMTGEPRAVIAPDDSNDNRIATTEWVRRNAVGVAFGRCDTDTDVKIKTVVLDMRFVKPAVFMMQQGSTVSITFSKDAIKEQADSANGKTGDTYYLDIPDLESSGPKPIKYGGMNILSEMIRAGYTYLFTYDGTNWNLENPTGIQTLKDSDNSNSIVSSEWVRRNAVGVAKGYCHTDKYTAAKIATLVSTYMDPVVFIRQIGSTVSLTFDEEDRSGKDNNTTLDVNGTGAAKVIYAGEAVSNYMIGKNFTHVFVFDGTYWRLINPVPGTGLLVNGGLTIGANPNPAEDTSDETVINKLSGYNGVTTQGSGGISTSGNVNRAWITINFSQQANDITVDFATNTNCWGLKMGDGTIIPATYSATISTTSTSVVAEFSLGDNWYASNSPCQLVYRTNKAYYTIKEL